MSGSRRAGKPHIMLGGDPSGVFGLGIPHVTADYQASAASITVARQWVEKRFPKGSLRTRLRAPARSLRSARIKADQAVSDTASAWLAAAELDRAHRLMATMRRPK